MAEKRMFTKKVTDSDDFISMSASAQALYFHLNQSADDDGFNNQIQIAMMKAHASNDDLLVLLSKNFIIRFESGVIVIKHWRMHNTLRKDRYVPTNYQEELKCLGLKDNGSYTLDLNETYTRLPDGCQTVAVDKIRLDKNSIDKNRKEKKEPVVYFPEDEKLNDAFKEYVKMRKQNKAPMTDHAVTLAINKLKKLSDGDNDVAIAILEQSIMNSWKGLFELKGQDKPTNKAAGINWDEV